MLLPYEELAAAEAKVMTLQLNQDGQLKIDPRCIHQCIVNLLDNALKYTQAGDRITVQSTFTDLSWQLTLSDTGIGIADTQKKTVFRTVLSRGKSRNRKNRRLWHRLIYCQVDY